MTERSANHYKNKIADLVGPEGVEWVEDINREQLLQSCDGGARWGHMTTNLAECINNVLKGVRNLPISSLIEATYYRMNEIFVKRGTQAEAMLRSGTVYSEKLIENIARNIDVSKSHSVSIHDRAQKTFRVKELTRPRTGRPASAFVVNLREKTCECGEFQALHYPCSHVIAACAKCNYDHMLFVDETFTVQNVFNTYMVEFPPLPTETSWPDFNTIELHHDPEKRRDKKGRPQSTRIRTEMDQRESGRRTKRCGICRNEGHNRNNCPNRN